MSNYVRGCNHPVEVDDQSANSSVLLMTFSRSEPLPNFKSQTVILEADSQNDAVSECIESNNRFVFSHSESTELIPREITVIKKQDIQNYNEESYEEIEEIANTCKSDNDNPVADLFSLARMEHAETVTVLPIMVVPQFSFDEKDDRSNATYGFLVQKPSAVSDACVIARQLPLAEIYPGVEEQSEGNNVDENTVRGNRRAGDSLETNSGEILLCTTPVPMSIESLFAGKSRNYSFRWTNMTMESDDRTNETPPREEIIINFQFLTPWFYDFESIRVTTMLLIEEFNTQFKAVIIYSILSQHGLYLSRASVYQNQDQNKWVMSCAACEIPIKLQPLFQWFLDRFNRQAILYKAAWTRSLLDILRVFHQKNCPHHRPIEWTSEPMPMQMESNSNQLIQCKPRNYGITIIISWKFYFLDKVSTIQHIWVLIHF